MRLSSLGKALLLWQITFLLLPPPCLYTLPATSQTVYQASLSKVSRHPCGCPRNGGACHSCRCFDCRGSCCPNSRNKAVPDCHPRQDGNHLSTILIRVLPCEGPEELNFTSLGKDKFILTKFPVIPGVYSATLARSTLEKPDNFLFKPPVPPPEIASLLFTASL